MVLKNNVGIILHFSCKIFQFIQFLLLFAILRFLIKNLLGVSLIEEANQCVCFRVYSWHFRNSRWGGLAADSLIGSRVIAMMIIMFPFFS